MKWKGGDAYGKVPERILAVPPLKVGGARATKPPPPLKVRGARPARQGLAGGGVMKLTHGFAEGKREQCLAQAEISM